MLFIVSIDQPIWETAKPRYLIIPRLRDALLSQSFRKGFRGHATKVSIVIIHLQIDFSSPSMFFIFIDSGRRL